MSEESLAKVFKFISNQFQVSYNVGYTRYVRRSYVFVKRTSYLSTGLPSPHLGASERRVIEASAVFGGRCCHFYISSCTLPSFWHASQQYSLGDLRLCITDDKRVWMFRGVLKNICALILLEKVLDFFLYCPRFFSLNAMLILFEMRQTFESQVSVSCERKMMSHKAVLPKFRFFVPLKTISVAGSKL